MVSTLLRHVYTQTLQFYHRLHTIPIIRRATSVHTADGLINFYLNSCELDNAVKVLVEISHPNPLFWNLVISGYNRQSRWEDSLTTFCRMRGCGSEPNQFTYGSFLACCRNSGNTRVANNLNSLVLKNGYINDDYVITGLVDLFAKNGMFHTALVLFLGAPSPPSSVCWNTIITGGVKNGEHYMTMKLYRRMVRGDYRNLNAFVFSSLLTACAATGELNTGRAIHGFVIKYGVEEDIILGNGVIDLYAKCGLPEHALKQFSSMPNNHGVVPWTTIISCFVQNDDYVRAFQLFDEMRSLGVETNEYTATALLAACSTPEMASESQQIHSWTLKVGFCSRFASVANALINMYGKIGNVETLERIFRYNRDDNSWAAMITALAQNNQTQRCVEIFQSMVAEGCRPDEFCMTSVISIVCCLMFGKQIHSYVMKSGLLSVLCLSSAVLTMYAKCGNLNDSCKVFDEISKRNNATWTSMMAGLSEHGYKEQVFGVMNEMVSSSCNMPDEKTLSTVLNACSSPQYLAKGKEIHGYVFRIGYFSNTLVSRGLIIMYSRCRAVDDASKIFQRMENRDDITWSSMISGYAQNGHGREALVEFRQMLASSGNFSVDHVTVSSCMKACGDLAKLGHGRQLHCHIMKSGLGRCVHVGSSLITMYANCGSINDSRRSFDEMEVVDKIAWSAIIDAYAQHGIGEEALVLYEEMKRQQVIPDAVTLIGVLSACRHSGLVQQGLYHFNSMSEEYGIVPNVHHYSCVVDLLCRSGRMKEAVEFMEKKMPEYMKRNKLIWTSVLGGCKLHGELDLGRKAAQKVIELEPNDPGTLTALSNICAEMGDWVQVAEIRELMRKVSLNKEPGWSFN